MEKLLYSREETAAMLSVSLSTVQELMHQGRLPGVRLGRRLLVHRDDIERVSRQSLNNVWKPKQWDEEKQKHVTVCTRANESENAA